LRGKTVELPRNHNSTLSGENSTSGSTLEQTAPCDYRAAAGEAA
jgi:hypothetical protein